MDPIIPDADGQAQQVKQLNAAQTEAESGSNYAEQAGLTGPAAPKPQPQTASWGALVKEHPVLSQHLVDPQFANAAKDDIPQLSKIERLFGGWDEMMWKSKLELESDSRNQQLAAIGRAQRNGTATPAMLKQADEIEKEAASVKEPNVGFVPGIVPSVVGVLPGLKRASNTAAGYALGGAAGGALVGGTAGAGVGAAPGALAGAITMGGAGFTVGMAMDTARTEQGLAYRQYVKAGADPKTAAIASDLVALANGGIQAIPVEKVFNMVPGISNLLAGKKTRDLVGSLITSNTGRAALQRFALRAGESGLLMALVGGGQELVRELGALGSGADDKLHGGRIWDAATGGLQQGLGFGLGHSIAPFIGDYREAKIGEARGEMYRAIANESKNSKLREQMPDTFKKYVNAVIAEHGNVEEAKAPAEKLTSLLQKEGVTDEQLQERMPEVAKQLKDAGPKDEIVIPMGDLATHLAPLKSFEEFSQDLRVGDDALTPRESKKIGELADKFEKEQPAAKEGAEPDPGRKVFDDVYDQLTKAGQDPNVARHDAALWAAFSTSRGERLGMDPFEYYKQRSLNIGAEFPKDGSMVLGQPLSDFMGMNKEQFLGRPRITRASNAADLKPSEGKSLESVPKEDFLGGKFKAKFSDKGAAVYDGDKVIASYSYLGGNTLVVDKKYRKQGIGQELVYQARTRYPDMPIAETRTIASQQLQEKVWRRIQKELARSIRVEQLSSDQFHKWFDGSQVVDKNGVPKVVYHGTSSGGFEYFDPKRADKKALKGPGFYFTENPEISSGYTEKAGGEAPAIYPVHLAIKNAFKEDSTAADLLPKLKQFKAEPPPPEIKQMIDASFKEDPSIASPESAGVWADNTEWAYKILDKMGTNGEEAFRPYFDYFIEHAVKYLEKEVKNGHIPKDEGFGAEVLGHIERNVFQSSDSSEGAGNIREVLEKLGFDGITHVGGNIVGDGTLKHRVWIAFEPTQIKSLFNRGTFDPKDPNILKQTLPKTETPEFKKWFGDSKIVDKDGNPLVVYHGTTASAGGKEPFTEFRTSPEFHEEGVENVSGMDPTAFLGAHFAKERSVAEKFARGIYRSKDYKQPKGYVFETYLSIKNPARMTETEMRERIFQQDVNDPLVDQYLEEGGGEDPEAAYERYKNDPEWRQEVNEDILLKNALHMEDESMLSSFASELADGFKRSLGEGVDGIIYKNEIEGGTSYVAFNPEQVKSVNNKGAFDPANPSILEQRGGVAGTEGYRGKISFDDARSYFNITLTGKANLSTFLHESGHAFFEFMRKDAESGHAQSQEDFGKLLEWMGVKAGEQPSTEQLEQFARGFEGYLMEGKAPAPGLRGLFRTFSSWLKQVYRGMKSLGMNLTDDVRGVMDRMLASDKEIEKAKEGLGLEPMKKPEGMTDAEYKAYTEKFGKAMEAGRNELEEHALKEFRNTIGEERAKTQAEVEAATKIDPAHNAYEVLRTGKRLDGGEVPPEIAGKKLDREAVAEAGHKGIKWASITEEGGLDPDVAAPLLGYADGPALLEALEGRRSRTKEIKEETERRMMDKYPNADLAKMSEQAVTALHLKDDVGNVLWLEAKAIGKQIGADDPRTARAVVKEIARRRTEDMTALEMQPGRFARGEERAAGEWADAMKAKDFEEAHRAKLDQILNHEMFKAVSEAKGEIDSIRNYLDGFNELPTRRRMGKAGQSYLSAIDAIISDIELKRQTNKTIERRASLESYLQEMENEDGALITIPAELRSEAALKNYKQMTLNDLRTINDAVANIEAMARLKNKLFDGRERRNYHDTAVRMAETVKANLGDSYADKPGKPQNPGFIAKKMEMLRRSIAEMKKIEFLARAMDGGETAGWVHSLIFQPFATAEEKALNLTKKITEELFKPLREMSLKERYQFDKTVDFLGTPMKVRDVIAVALNMGNNGNKKKLLDGYAYRGWTEEKVLARLGEVLTDKHLDLISHFWKTIGSLWPEIKALSERTTGVAPPKVEPAKLTVRGRELEGGYYPIVYDRDRSYKAEQIAQRKGDLFENNFLKPGVSKGFTEARTQFAAPILLSLNVIPSHMNEVIHYLTHLEPIRAVDRLMAHPEVRKSVTEAMGKETYNLFRPWLQAIAHDGVVSENTTTIDNVLRHLRVGASVTRLGFRLTNSIMQGFNTFSSVKELGGFVGGSKYLTLGMKAFMKDLDSFRDPFKAVHELSPEIRGKTEKFENNLIGNFDHFTSAFSEFGHYKERLGHFAMSFMTLAWKSVETVTWYAAREKAFDEGHPRPHEYADSVVRLSQMGEGMKDKAAVMRGGEGTKIFTYMYSWYSTIFNQLTETQPQARGGWAKAGELASRYWWMVLAPTVMMSIARGKKPKHDDGEVGTEAGYLAGEVALETAKSYLGPIGGIAADTMLSGHDAKFAPWISTVLRGLVVRGKMAAGHTLTEHEKKDLFESTGIISHLPAGALYNALKYVSAVQDGKLEEPVRDLLFRSPGDWK